MSEIQTITPAPDSRLAQLLAEFEAAKRAAEAAHERLNMIKDGIKAELTAAAPGAEKVRVHSDHLTQPLQLSARTEWRIDARRLKAEDPVTWVRYARRVTSWRLESVR